MFLWLCFLSQLSHACLSCTTQIPMYTLTQTTKTRLYCKESIYLLVRQKCAVIPWLYPGSIVFCWSISFCFRQKKWHQRSHLMCALNIRWGHKGSIQEFSTLLWALGLLCLLRATQKTRTGWNTTTFTTTTTTTTRHKLGSSGFAGWLVENKSDLDWPRLRLTLPCSLTSGLQPLLLPAPPCTAAKFLQQKLLWVPGKHIWVLDPSVFSHFFPLPTFSLIYIQCTHKVVVVTVTLKKIVLDKSCKSGIDVAGLQE